LNQSQGNTKLVTETDRLELAATPDAATMLREALEMTGLDAFRVAHDRILLEQVQAPIPEYATGLDPTRKEGRDRFSPLLWDRLEEVLLAHGIDWRTDKQIPDRAFLTSRAGWTVAQVCWRLANDRTVRSHLAGQRVNDERGLEPPVQLPDEGSEVADHALAVIATCLVGDGVRYALRRLAASSGGKWHQLSPARILWTVYTSPDGPGLVPGSRQVRERFKDKPPPIPIGRRKATFEMIKLYDDATRAALARRVSLVARHWCEPNPDSIGTYDLEQRAAHWSDAALTQLWIWLGCLGKDRDAHGRADEPW
jgi:hypothetical protein